MITRSRLRAFLCLAASAGVFSAAACGSGDHPPLSASERTAIADSLKRMVVAAYDLSKTDVVSRMMSLYPPSGRVISAAAGSVFSSNASGKISDSFLSRRK